MQSFQCFISLPHLAQTNVIKRLVLEWITTQ